MQRFHRGIVLFLYFVLTGFIAACGGGGGGGGGSVPSIVQPPSSNANLASLSLVGEALEQTFQANQSDYSATLGFLASAIEVSFTRADGGARVELSAEMGASISGNKVFLSEGENRVLIRVTAADGASVREYRIDVARQGINEFVQEAYIKASNTDPFDAFGASIALHGNTLVVGAPGEDALAAGFQSGQQNNSSFGAGAVYVFTRDGGSWSQQAYLKAPNPDVLDQYDAFGASVALEGDVLAVGAPHEASGAAGIDGDKNDNSADSAGAVYIYRRIGDTWSLQSYVKASNPHAYGRFGSSVALNAGSLAVGAPDEAGAGAVYLFRDTGSQWSQQAYIKASNAGIGDLFGAGVSLDGDRLAVAAPGEDSAATGLNGDGEDNSAQNSGAVYLFSRSASVWSQQVYLKASNTDSGDRFGAALALYGSVLAVAAPGEASLSVNDQSDNLAPGTGAVYVYRHTDDTWSQQAYLKPANLDAGDRFGVALGLNGSTLVVGADGESSYGTGINAEALDNSKVLAGAAYVFAETDGQWAQQAYIKASNSDSGDRFGLSITLAGSDLAVMGMDASSARGVNSDQSNNSAPNAGALYLFR